MRTIDWPSARSTGALLWMAALTVGTACQEGDPAPTLPPPVAGAPAPVPIAPVGGAVAQPAASVDPALAAAAAPASTPAPALDVVDANGVRGELVQANFLSDAAEGRRNLIQVDWEIPAGTEQYLCGRVTVTEDVYLKAFYALSPLGTHHTLVTVLSKPDGPDGVVECDAAEVGTRSVTGSGVGTPSRQLPPGIAMKLERGTQLLLNLHLFNVNEAPLRGRSGTLAETTPPESVTVLADSVSVGPIKLVVPPGRSVQSGVCTVDYDYTIFSVVPHMHQMGVHMKVVARPAAGAELVLHDGPYEFENQIGYRLDPLALKKGDTMLVECTYENTTGQTLHFGESTKDEMCLAGMARYPAGGKIACPF